MECTGDQKIPRSFSFEDMVPVMEAKKTLASFISSPKRAYTWHFLLCHRKILPWFNSYTVGSGEWKIQETRDTTILASGNMCGTCGHVDARWLYIIQTGHANVPYSATFIPSDMGSTMPWVNLSPAELVDEQVMRNDNSSTIGVKFRVHASCN